MCQIKASACELRSQIITDIVRIGGKMQQVGMPVLGDLQPCRHPDAVVLADVVEEAHQGRSAAGPADQAAMQADRHHLRRRRAFLIEHVKTVLEIGEEFLAAAKALRGDKAHVVGVERVGDDELRPPSAPDQ